MDSLTHLIAGGVTPFIFPKIQKRWAMLIFGICAGEFPDIDFFWGNGSAEDLMLLHRGLSHALLMQPCFAFVLSIPFYYYCRMRSSYRELFTKKTLEAQDFGEQALQLPPSFFMLFIIACIAMFLHLFLDCMTTFGTQIFLPFSAVRVAFPSMFIIDLLFTGIALLLLIKALCASQKELLKKSRYCFAWLIAYPMLTLMLNYSYEAALERRLPVGQSVRLLPEPFSPFVWKYVQESGQEIQMTGMFFWEGLKKQNMQTYIKPDPLFYRCLEEQDHFFTIFRWFSPTMVVLSHESSPGRGGVEGEYSFVDIRYILTPQMRKGFFLRFEPNFVLQARVTGENKLLAYRFLFNKARSEPWVNL